MLKCRKGLELYRTIKGMERVLVVSLHAFQRVINLIEIRYG